MALLSTDQQKRLLTAFQKQSPFVSKSTPTPSMPKPAMPTTSSTPVWSKQNQSNIRNVTSSQSTPTPATTSRSSSFSSSSSRPASTPTPTPAAWMGNMYKPVAGTDWWSTNPDNPNASRFNLDGTPVASVGLTTASGQRSEGWTDQDTFNRLISTPTENQFASLQGLFNNGGITTQADINKRINTPTPAMATNQNTRPVSISSAGSTPMPSFKTQSFNSSSGAIPNNNIANEAAFRIQKLRDERQRIAGQTKGSLQTSFNRGTQDITQNRNLEDVKNQRLLSPTSGRSDFAQGIIAMERARTDRERQTDLDTRLAQVDQELANWENLAPEQQMAIQDELTRMERDFGLQVGQLTGNFNGQQTLAARNADRDFQFGIADRTGVLNGIPTLQSQNQAFNQDQQSWENRFNFGQAIGQFSNGQQTIQKANQDWQQAFEQGQFDLQKAQQIWENTFQERSFEQDMAEAAASRGLQWASLSQRDKEFVADQEFRERSFQHQKEQDKISNDLAASKANAPAEISSAQAKNNAFAEYTAALDALEPDEVKTALEQEKENIIRELGPSSYTALVNMYFDKNGNPK